MNRIIQIIREEIEEIIISEEQYNADDVVDFNKINLRDEFNKLNSLLFDNQVPEIPLKWSNRKTALGHVKQTVNKRTREILKMELWISKFFEVTYRQFLNTLAHEMIHVLLNQNDIGNMYDPHGFEFLKEAQRINNLGLGFNITTTNGEDLALSKETKQRLSSKERIAIVFEISGKYYVATTTPQVYQRDNYTMLNMLQNAVNKGRLSDVEVNVIKTTNPELAKYSQQRTFERKIAYAPIDDNLLEELLNDEIIRTVKITKNGKEDTQKSGGFSGMIAEELETILIS